MYIKHGELDLLGHLRFRSCNSFGSGGGLLIEEGGVRQVPTSSLEFFQCSALGAHGGGASATVEHRDAADSLKICNRKATSS